MCLNRRSFRAIFEISPLFPSGTLSPAPSPERSAVPLPSSREDISYPCNRDASAREHPGERGPWQPGRMRVALPGVGRFGSGFEGLRENPGNSREIHPTGEHATGIAPEQAPPGSANSAPLLMEALMLIGRTSTNRTTGRYARRSRKRRR